MAWTASLQLQYTCPDPESAHTRVHFLHDGPLRVLQSLYPEGPGICHNVLIHPPSGLVGGDLLDIQLEMGPAAHALVTTPGATRFYRSEGEAARQLLHARLEPGARLEWLPLESIAYNRCQAENIARFDLQGNAEVLGWDITALGLPSSGLPYEEGTFTQELSLKGHWLERGCIGGQDGILLDSPMGMYGQRCMGTLFFLSGQTLAGPRAEAALEALRTRMDDWPDTVRAGATQPHDQVLVLRVLGPLVEPVMNALKQARGIWRQSLWGLPDAPPRVWSV